MNKLDALYEAGKGVGERRDCAIRAMCIACGYEDDYEGMHRLFQQCGRRLRCGTNAHTLWTVADKLGFLRKNVTPAWQSVKTVNSLIKRWQNYRPTTPHIVFVRDHIFAMTHEKVWEPPSKKHIRWIYALHEVGRPFLTAWGRNIVQTKNIPTPRGQDVTFEYMRFGGFMPEGYKRIYLSTDEEGIPCFHAIPTRKVPHG